MKAMPERAAALPPASQYVIPTHARSRKNVACTYRPMPATVASFQDHFISPHLPPSRGPEVSSKSTADPPGASVVSRSAPYSLPLEIAVRRTSRKQLKGESLS